MAEDRWQNLYSCYDNGSNGYGRGNGQDTLRSSAVCCGYHSRSKGSAIYPRPFKNNYKCSGCTAYATNTNKLSVGRYSTSGCHRSTYTKQSSTKQSSRNCVFPGCRKFPFPELRCAESL